MNYKEIGNYISIKKQEKGISTDELSKKLNVPVKRIKSWEKGRRCPDPDKMKELCDMLGITLNELLLARDTGSDELISEDVIIDIIKENNKIEKAFRTTIVSIILLLGGVYFVNHLIFDVGESSDLFVNSVIMISAIIVSFESTKFNKRIYKKKDK